MLNWLINNPIINKSNENFYAQVSPDIIDTSSNIKINCFSHLNKSIIPCKYQWFRTRNQVTTLLTHLKGNAYMCQPSDIGSSIKVIINSLDNQCKGQLNLEFGPIKMDMILKKNVQKILSNGFGDFPVFIYNHQNQKQCSVRLTNTHLQLKNPNCIGTVKLLYSSKQIIMEISQRINNHIEFTLQKSYESQIQVFLINLFENKYQNPQNVLKIEMRFINRISRDLFLFSYKAFQAKKQIQTVHVLNLIQNIDMSDQKNFNYLLEIQSLREDLEKFVKINQNLSNQKQKLAKQTIVLSQQIKFMKSMHINRPEYSNAELMNNQTQNMYQFGKNKMMKNLGSQNSLMSNSPQNKQLMSSKVKQKRKIFQKSKIKLLDGISIQQDYQKQNQKISQKQSIENILHNINLSQYNDFQKLNISGIQEKQPQNHKINQQILQNNSHKQIKLNQNHQLLQKQLSEVRAANGLMLADIYYLRDELEYFKSKCQSFEKKIQQLIQENKILIEKNTIKHKILYPIQQIVRQQNQLDEINRLSKKLKEKDTIIQELKLEMDKLSKQKGKMHKKYEQILQENKYLRKGNEIANKSLGLSHEVQEYNQQQLNIIKQHNQILLQQNEKLSRMCQLYYKDSKQLKNTKLELIKMKILLKQKSINIDQLKNSL